MKLHLSLPFILFIFAGPILAPTLFAADSQNVSAALPETSNAALLAQRFEVSRTPIQDKEIDQYRLRLLEIAFDNVSKMPTNPHESRRTDEQLKAVDTYLELGQPGRALEVTRRITDWRKGHGLAKVATALAKDGQTARVPELIDEAEAVADQTEDWRRDRIRVEVAQTYALLGDQRRADIYEAGVEASEQGKLDVLRLETGKSEDFDQDKEILDALMSTENFDIQKNALPGYKFLYEKYFDNTEYRDRIEEHVLGVITRLPVFIRYESLRDFAEIAIRQGDNEKAIEMINRADEMVRNLNWSLEYYFSYSGELVELRYRAGKKELAKNRADELLGEYREREENIVNIWRGMSLRPLAEAYHAMGDGDSAKTVYRMALDAGMVNPNLWPRSRDLSATLRSMAVHEFEPDEELWARINQISQELGKP